MEHRAAPPLPVLDRDLSLADVDQGTRRYFASCRARVAPFVDAHFSVPGALRVHRAALGWDIAKAPLNLTLAAPQVAILLGAKAAARLGVPRAARLLRRPILLQTAILYDTTLWNRAGSRRRSRARM